MTTDPERTCVGCRRAGPKSQLHRVVSGVAGWIDVDLPGTAPGRGAYVHPSPVCIEAATRKGVLAKALRMGIGPDELGTLRDILSQGAL